MLAPRRLRLGVLGENRRALGFARRGGGRRRDRRAVGGGPLRREVPEPDRAVGGLQRRQRQRVQGDVERANKLVHAPLVRLAGGFHRVVPAVLPLGKTRVVAKLLRRGLTRRLDAPLHRRRELRVVPPRVVQHARQRALAGTAAGARRRVRVIVVVVVVAVAEGASRFVSANRALRGSRLRLHGHVRVELPQQVEPRAELADGRALHVLLQSQGHLAQALSLLGGQTGGVHAAQVRFFGVVGHLSITSILRVAHLRVDFF